MCFIAENEKALEKIAAINEGQSKTSLNVYDVYEANARAMFSSDTTMTITTVFYRNEAHELITCDVVITKFRVFIYPKSADKPFHVFHLLMVKSISYENGIVKNIFIIIITILNNT